MEINKLTSAVGMYKKIGSDYKNTAKADKKAVSSAKNVDTFEISAAARSSVESAKAAVKKQADSDAPAERIAALKAKIADGSYNVSPENVAAAIFEG
ncbi:MAG: flagellar biosynthesis anti-sigma factor FlgM [Oscillospiraceae bacterium]|nr:flagellar biosynthesis anti-sigma factor FlgM [Oscillospiraceae bacterium]